MYVRSELHKTNAACTSLYERVRANGKTGKQALIAICNELIKQVYEVVKNGIMYQPNYCPGLYAKVATLRLARTVGRNYLTEEVYDLKLAVTALDMPC